MGGHEKAIIYLKRAVPNETYMNAEILQIK